jgi:lysozyme
MLPGVDVSSFQGQPAAWQGAAGPIRYAGVKLTELGPGANRYANPDAAADWAYLKQKNLGRIAYLFAHPSASPGASVSFFAGLLAQLGLDDADAVAVDLEQTDGLGPAQVNEWALEVTNLMQSEYGRVPLLYTYLSYAQAGNCASLGHLPLWMSDPSSPMGHPRVPAPWTDFAIHQYSTGGAIDRDLAAYPSLAAMTAALGKQVPKPPEEDMKFIQDVSLSGPVPVPASGRPVMLKWAAAAGQPSLLGPGGQGAVPGAGAVISSVNVRVSRGASLRFTLAESPAAGGAPEPVNAEFSDSGGWVLFTTPFRAQGGMFTVEVTNYGTVSAELSQGTWQLLR